MGFNYDKSITIAKKLLIKFGDIGIISQNKKIPIDPEKYWLGFTSEKNILQDVLAVIIPVSNSSDNSFQGATSLIANVSRSIIQVAEKITVGDVLTYRSGDYRIEKVTSVKPCDKTIIYDCIVTEVKDEL